MHCTRRRLCIELGSVALYSSSRDFSISLRFFKFRERFIKLFLHKCWWFIIFALLWKLPITKSHWKLNEFLTNPCLWLNKTVTVMATDSLWNVAVARFRNKRRETDIWFKSIIQNFSWKLKTKILKMYKLMSDETLWEVEQKCEEKINWMTLK